MIEFHTPRNRDAWPTIQGYVYQVELSIVRWLDLLPGEQLELECGEDIDKVSGIITASGEEQDRILEQVKHLESESITLHSGQVLAALANFHAHRTANPSITLRLRFTTNARRGQEHKTSFPEGMFGLDAWEGICTGTLQAPLFSTVLEEIRSILKTSHQPHKFPEECWRDFQTFVENASDEELLKFIRSCEWSTQTADAPDVHLIIQQRLRDAFKVADEIQVEEVSSRLFLYVFRLLSQRGRKVLTIEQRTQLFNKPTLSASDHEMLDRLKDMYRQLQTWVRQLASNLEVLKLQEHRQDERITTIEQQVEQFASEQGIDVAIAYTNVTPILDIPPLIEDASRRTDTVQNLREKVEQHIWTAVHGNASTGKTQLTILLVHDLRTSCIWIRLANTLSPEQNSVRLDAACTELLNGKAPQSIRFQWYKQLIKQLGEHAVIVLDDLPRLTGSDELSQRLIELARACKNERVRMLSTSPYRLPENIHSILGSQTLYAEASPPLTDYEATEILQEYGAPDALLANGKSFNALAGRHPMLLSAMARYLQTQHWRWNEETLSALFQRQYAANISEDILYRLLKTVEDDQSRELLYRLNFILGSFSYEDVRALAAVVPEVARLRERLTSLAGLWVERDTNERFRVSPLIHALGSDDVALATRQACNRVLGERIIQRKKINPSEVREAILYFVQAGELNRAGLLLIRVLIDMNHHAQPVPDAGLLLLWNDLPLPQEMNLGIRLYLRGAQIAVRLTWQQDIPPFLLMDLTDLLEQITAEEVWAVLGVLLIAHEMLPNIQRTFLTVLRSLPHARFYSGKPITLPEEVHIEMLIWIIGAEIKTVEDLRDWIASLEELTLEQRAFAFGTSVAEEGCLSVADSVWRNEASKPTDQQNWDTILTALRDLKSHALYLGLELLWACAVQAEIVVLASFRHNLAEALTTTKNSLAIGTKDPRVEFLIKECIGRECIAARKNAEARSWLDQALAVNTQAYPSKHLAALIFAGQAAGSTDAQAALHFAQRALDLAKTDSRISELEQVQALGELGIANWLVGDSTTAFALWDQAGTHLFACKDESHAWKQLLLLSTHVLGYLAPLVTKGQPPVEVRPGDPYIAPSHGFLLTSIARADALYSEVHEIILMGHLFTLAQAIDQHERAIAWGLQGFERAQRIHQVLSFAPLSQDLISVLILHYRYDQALVMAQEMVSVIVAAIYTQSTAEHDPKAIPDARRLLSQTEEGTAFMALLPLMVHLGTDSLSDPKVTLERAKNLLDVDIKFSDTTLDQGWWVSATMLIDTTFVHPIPARELNRLGNEFGQKHDACLSAMGYLGSTLQRDCSLNDALNAHSVIFSLMRRKYQPTSIAYRRIILPFFTTYWRISFEQRRFLFSNPRLVESELIAANTVSEPQRVQAILKAVALGLNGDRDILRHL